MAIRRYGGTLDVEGLQAAVDELCRGHEPRAIVESLLEIAYPRPNEAIKAGDWRRGRVFTALSELTWEQVDTKSFDVVWLSEGEEEPPPGLDERDELTSVACIPRKLELWGPNNTRLPDRPDYSISGGRPVVSVCEYRDRVSWRLVAYRYCALEAE